MMTRAASVVTDYGQSRGYDAYHYGHPADGHCVDRRVAINQCIVVIDVHMEPPV